MLPRISESQATRCCSPDPAPCLFTALHRVNGLGSLCGCLANSWTDHLSGEAPPVGSKREMTDFSSPNVFHFYRGRVALCALLRATGVQPGDEVVLQAFTCLAVPAPIVGLGARPVYVDVDRDTYSFDLDDLERKLSKRTRAIIVQHTFGIPARLGEVLCLARRYGAKVIEDCAHACGSTYEKRQIGQFGDAAFYSFEWGKPLVIGLGGVGVVNSAALLDSVRTIHDGLKVPPFKDMARVRVQYRLHQLFRRPAMFWLLRDVYRRLSARGIVVGSFDEDEIQGRLSDDYQRKMPRSLQKRLARKSGREWLRAARRRAITEQYAAGCSRLGIDSIPIGPETVLLRYPVVTKDKARVLQGARARKIELGDWYSSPVHPLSGAALSRIAGYEEGSCPTAEELAHRVVTFPVDPDSKGAAVERNLAFLGEMVTSGTV